jgi:23S rRNA pseudouridine2605 synthase
MRLIRIAFGPFYLGELERGTVAEVPTQALDNLLGLKPPPRKPGWAKPHQARPHQARPKRRR